MKAKFMQAKAFLNVYRARTHDVLKPYLNRFTRKQRQIVLTSGISLLLLVIGTTSYIYIKSARQAKETGEDHIIELTDDEINASKIVIEEVASHNLKMKINAVGKVGFNEDETAHIGSRFSGVVKQLKKQAGDVVKAGDSLASVESNASMSRFDAKSPINGTVIRRDVSIGEYVTERNVLYTVSNLDRVWVDFNVSRSEFEKIKVGQQVVISTDKMTPPVLATLSYISSISTESTQSILARALYENKDRKLLPGSFVSGEILLDDAPADKAVRAESIQKFENESVVFLRDGQKMKPVIIETGRTDGEWVEILSGVEKGTRYAARNSKVLKTELSKTSTSHKHHKM